MCEPQVIEKTDLLEQQNDSYNELEEALRQVGSKIEELEALLSVIKLSAHKLNEPMTIILGLSELLVSQVDPDSPPVTDLAAIVKQIRRMSKIVKRINQLTAY